MQAFCFKRSLRPCGIYYYTQCHGVIRTSESTAGQTSLVNGGWIHPLRKDPSSCIYLNLVSSCEVVLRYMTVANNNYSL